MNWILESQRLGFRKLCHEDFTNVAQILQNIDIMYAWEHGFTDSEVVEWIDKNILRYENEGFSYFAVIEKSTNHLLGMMGPLIEDINGAKHIGIAYILNNRYWGKGFATEGARACIEYAFESLHAENIIAQIRSDNHASRKVAESLGMQIIDDFVKHYNGKDIQHLIYSIDKKDWIHNS